MGARQMRPDLPKKMRVSISMTQEEKAEVQAQADHEGHRNFSAVLLKAFRLYKDRLFPTKEASDADRAA